MSDRYEVSVRDGQIELPQEVVELFNQVRTIDSTIKALKEQKDAIEKPLKAAMQKYKVSKFQCDYMTAYTVAPTVELKVNVDKLRADGLFEKYSYPSPKAGYVAIKYKKEKDNG